MKINSAVRVKPERLGGWACRVDDVTAKVHIEAAWSWSAWKWAVNIWGLAR